MNKTRIALCLLVAAALLPAAGTAKSSSKAAGAPSAKTKGKAKKPAVAVDTAAKSDLLRLADSLARKAKNARAADSLGRIADSLHRVDSLARVADSVRRADSTALAERTWSVALPAGTFREPDGGLRLRERLELALRRAGRVGVVRAVLTDSVTDPLVASRLARAGRTLALQVSEDPSGSLGWSARLLSSATGEVLDTASGGTPAGPRAFSRLSRGLVARLLGLPSDTTAARPAPSPVSWTFSLDSDSGTSRSSLRSLDSALRAAFGRRTDRSFVAPPESGSFRIDSLSQARGIARIAAVHLSGKAPQWAVRAAIRAPGVGPSDSLALTRQGPRGRTFAWFARHIAAFGNDPRPCDTCAEATRRQAARWALVPDSAPTPATARVVEALRATAQGRLAELPTPLPCRDRACLDSIAQSRSIAHLVEIAASNDSGAWKARSRSLDVRTDDWVDSASVRDTSARRIALRLWNEIAPLPGCELCVDTDTLEAGLALVVHPWTGGTDSAAAAYRDTLVRVLSREGGYQVLGPDPSAGWTPQALSDSISRAELRCRTGASYVLDIAVERDSTGWKTLASLRDAATGSVMRSLESRDSRVRPSRPVEMSAWTARRILGTETRETAPDPKAIPWKKVLLLGIPAVVGIGSTIMHW